MKVLRLHVKKEYFDAMKSGKKKYEYRLCKEYWKKRLHKQQFARIEIFHAYPAKTDASKKIERPWLGCFETTITHKEFGPKPVRVYAIAVN